MSGRGFKVGKIFGIEIFIDYSWLIIFALIAWLLSVRYYPLQFRQLGQTTNIILGVLTTILFFASALIHEIAHSVVAKMNNMSIKRITLFLFGGMSELFEEPANAEIEFKIAIAGPATSIVLAILFLILWEIFEHYLKSTFLVALTSTLFQVNVILALFNLLPGFPLDGGRILRSIVWNSTKDLIQSTRIATLVGQFVAFMIIIFGVLEVIITGLWSGVWLILIGLFLIQAASQSYLELQIKETLKNIKVESLLNSNIMTLSPNLSIDSALSEYFLKYSSQSFPVLENNRIIGLISLKDLRNKINKLDDESRVNEAMKSYPNNVSVKSDDTAIDALKLMIEKDIAFIPVRENDRIIGMITLESIADYLAEKGIL